jgi:ferredoxin
VALVTCAFCLWHRARRWRRKASEWAALAELGQETNYRLACQLHGKAVVDRAIHDAHAKGAN